MVLSPEPLPGQGTVGMRESVPGMGGEPVRVPGLLGHLRILHSGQCVLGGPGGLLHVAMHEAQEGGVLGFCSSCRENRTEQRQLSLQG